MSNYTHRKLYDKRPAKTILYPALYPGNYNLILHILSLGYSLALGYNVAIGLVWYWVQFGAWIQIGTDI